MITSNFTLEYDFAVVKGKTTAAPNLPRSAVPPQLLRLGVPAAAWHSLYDYAAGVVERAVAREDIKRRLDASVPSGVSLFGKKNATSREEVERQKAGHDRETRKGWDALLTRCNDALGRHGATATLVVAPSATGTVCVVDFRCSAARLSPQKLVLEHDKRKKWSWPRDSVPDELRAANVDQQSWAQLWDAADATLKKVSELEEARRGVQRDIAQLDSGISPFRGDLYDRSAVTEAIRSAARLLERKAELRHEQEHEWNKLEDWVHDLTHSFPVSVRLLPHKSPLAAGLVFRFRPAPAVAVATAVVPSAPRATD